MARRGQDRWSRAGVKAAPVLIATTPGLADTLARNWQKAARFYARFRITETMLRAGVRQAEALDVT
jgi:hypothetical protein